MVEKLPYSWASDCTAENNMQVPETFTGMESEERSRAEKRKDKVLEQGCRT